MNACINSQELHQPFQPERKFIQMILPVISKWNLMKYIFLGIASGLCSFLFINSVTRVVSLLIAGNLTTISKEYLILFSFIILFFIWIRKTLSLAIINLSQSYFWGLRKQVIALVLKADYKQLSERRVNIETALVSDINILTQASLSIIEFFTASILAVACLIYLAVISFILFSITLAVAFTGILIYHFSTRRNIGNFVVARKLENKFLLNFNAILGGFKEIFMEPKKGRAIYENKIIPTANSTLKNNTAAFTGYLNNQITGQTLFYILISSVLLFLSITLKVKPGDTVSFVFTLLYLLGSIETIMVLIPGLMRARVASNHLADLKKELERSNFENVPGNRYMSKDEFESITISKLEFSYGEVEKSFSIGPVNLTIEKGEAIFIYGGNGSGKTTLIHSLLGICTPSAGQIRLNNEPVGPSNYRDYKAIFSVVFNDFYLFEELYGIDNLDIQKLNFYLRLFELEEKVEFEGRSFSTTTLSMGQRKRLALITCLLEEKPVLVLDEWAADQDPYFRKKFYKEIIPLLKKDGFTIIAITHDDKYYPYADRLYKMDDGKLIEDSIKKFETTLIS